MKAWQKLRHLVGRRARVARLEEEMRTHLELLTEEKIRRGLDPAEARRQAHLAFGNQLATREETEDVLGWPSLESWAQDLKIVLRALLRRPAFSISIAAVLALGIGVTTAVFSLVRGVLLEPLPVPNPDEIRLAVAPGGEPAYLSAPTARRLADNPGLSGRVLAYSSTDAAALRLGDAPAERALLQFVSGEFFSTLGIPARHGRMLVEVDAAPGAPRAVAVASHAFWQKKLNADPAAVGRSVRLNGQEVTIVGVAPAGFTGVSLGDNADLWLPIGAHAPLRIGGNAWIISSQGAPTLEQWTQLDTVAWLSVMVRAPAGEASLTAALAAAWQPQLDAALAIVTDPDSQRDLRSRAPRWVPSPQGFSDTRNDFQNAGLTLSLLVGAVLLVTAANTATLLLLRVLGRTRELGVRLALGAGRWRLARAVVFEGLALSVFGAAAGVVLGLWLAPIIGGWLVPAAGGNLPGLDLELVAWLVVLALALGVAVGGLPAWLAAHLSPLGVLQQRGFGAGGSLRFGRALIVAQLALSVLLIAVAGSLALDLQRVLDRPPGYARASVVQAFFDLGEAGIPRARHAAVLEHLRATARELPRVRSVGFAAGGVLSGSRSNSGLYFRGDGVRQPRDSVQHETIDPDYLATMGTTLARGRGFTAADAEGKPNVALVSERLAREVFGPADPLGRRFGFGPQPEDGDREIVGIVADARVNSVRGEPPAMFYTPLAQWRAEAGCLVVRVEGDAKAARTELQKKISAAEPGLMFTRWATLEERAQRWVRNDTATMWLTTGFGALATLLAVIGVVGALGYLVASRSRDIAVRLAIGADPARMWRDVLLAATRLGLIGSALGAGLTALLPRLTGSWMLTGLQTDWVAVGLALVAGMLAAALGGLLPARRAAKVDPLTLLKAE